MIQTRITFFDDTTGNAVNVGDEVWVFGFNDYKELVPAKATFHGMDHEGYYSTSPEGYGGIISTSQIDLLSKYLSKVSKALDSDIAILHRIEHGELVEHYEEGFFSKEPKFSGYVDPEEKKSGSFLVYASQGIDKLKEEINKNQKELKRVRTRISDFYKKEFSRKHQKTQHKT